MKRSFTALIATAVMTTMATASDFNYPSAGIPGGYSKDEVKQIVSFIWDDNAYSGLSATQYEAKPGDGFASSSFVDGIAPWGNPGKPNELNLTPGMMGMSWAAYTLPGYPMLPETWNAEKAYAPNSTVLCDGNIYESGNNWPEKGKSPAENNSTVDPKNIWGWTLKEAAVTTPSKLNPDGSPMTMTFNVISGLMVPIAGAGWESYQSKFGYFKPNEAFYKDGRVLHSTVSVSWGREMRAYVGGKFDSNGQIDTAGLADGSAQGGQIVDIFKRSMDLGHELGNHTIDHMESNSPLPYSKENPYMGNVEGVAYMDGFKLWDGEGFDSTKLDPYPWGGEGNEAEEFGQKDGNPWQFMGWRMYAGKWLSEKAWGGAIKLSEEQLDEYLGLSVAKGNLYSFRAPRLEVSSGMFYALKNQGYEYDCGNEEGYEMNRDGTNFVWPYTTDNGTPNNWTQAEFGENIMIDSMPDGLWQYPVNTMVVPEEIRPAVWANHNIIATAEGEPLGDVSEWNGKVTGFDFNMFILWGMTGDQVTKTLENTLNLRLAGNKAPMQIGCHTDYFTPIYDNATLSNDQNKDVFGLCLQNNTWKDRIAVFEGFVDYALAKGAHFKSGHETIEYVRSLVNNPKKPLPDASKGKEISGSWEFIGQGATAASETVSDLKNISVTFEGVSAQYASYVHTLDAPVAIEAIEIPNYQISSAVKVGVHFEDGKEVSALLNNLKRKAHSGIIPLYQLEANPYAAYKTEDVDITQKVTSITVSVLTPGAPEGEQAPQITQTASLEKIKYYTSDDVAVGDAATLKSSALSFNGIKDGMLNLSVAKAGTYSVKFYGMNGRVVKSLNHSALTAGTSQVGIGSLPAGVYILNVTGNGLKLSTKALIK